MIVGISHTPQVGKSCGAGHNSASSTHNRLNTMNDWQLLAEYTERRAQDAFRELVRRHLPLVIGVCRRRLRDPAAAEDVAQAVFLLLARRPPKRRGEAELGGWLFKTAHYACKNALRSKMTRDRHESSAAVERAEAMAKPVAIDSQSAEMLDNAMSELPPADRDVLMLRFHSALDIPEVAAHLNLPSNTVAKRISRALDKVRKFFERNGAQFSVPIATQQLAALSKSHLTVETIARVADVAMSNVAATSQVAQIYERMIQMIRKAQMRVAATITAAALVIGGGGAVSVFALLRDQTPPIVASAAVEPGKSNVSGLEERSIDARTPMQILEAFAKATRAGDAKTMRSLVHAGDAMRQRLLDAACNYAEASVALRKAVAKEFGEPAAQALAAGNFSPLDSFASFIEQAAGKMEPKIDGDVAIFAPPGTSPEEAFYLERIEGEWKISAAKTTETWTDQMAEERGAMLNGVTDALARLTQEVSDGKYASAKEFMETVQQMFGRK